MTGASSPGPARRRLRTASSASSLRLQAFGGVLHAGDMDSNSNGSIFQDTTLRWAGCAITSETGQPSSDGCLQRQPPPPPPSFWPDWNWTGQESSNEDINIEETEYQGSEASLDLATPTFPLPVAVIAANNNNKEIIEQATPTKKQRQHHPPIQRIHGQSHTRTPSEQRQHQDCMPDQAAAAEGEDHYSSLEHMLAKSGFQQCRVITPPDSVQKSLPRRREDQHDRPRSVSPSPLASTAVAVVDDQVSPSPSPTSPSPNPLGYSDQAASSELAINPSNARALTQQHASTTTKNNHNNNTLKGKASLLSLTASAAAGFVSNLWATSAPLGAPGAAPLAITPPALNATPALAPKTRAEKIAEARLDDERKATIRGWLAQTATSMASLSSPPTPSGEHMPCSSTSSAPSAEGEQAQAGSSDMHRTSTESTLESAPIETPGDSPAPSAHFGNIKDIRKQEQAQAQASYALTASSLSRLRHALSDGAIRGSATLPSSGLVGAAIAPVNNNSSKGYPHPSIASIFGSMLPSFPSGRTKPEPTFTRAVHSCSPAQEGEVIARPAPAIVVQSTPQPEPRLLRKTASQHTLRKVARPLLDTAEVIVLPDFSSSSPSEETPKKRTTTEAVPLSGAGVPRHVAHRNPRDSPVGETRVVKSSPVTIASGRSAALNRRTSTQHEQQVQESVDSPVRKGRSSKGPSILDAAGEEGGLWTAPPSSTTQGSPSQLASCSSSSFASNGLPSCSSSSSTSTGAPPRRPQLRAKESLEHILAIRKRQEAADLERSLRKLEKEKAAAVQARQQSPAGRRALGQLSSFHREALSSGSASGSGSGSEAGTPPASPTLHEEQEECPVFKMPVVPMGERPSPPTPKRSTSMPTPTPSSPSTMGVNAGKSKSEQQGKLVRGPAVVGGPKRPLALVGSAPQQQTTQGRQVGKAPPIPERTFTGTLKGLLGTAMDWIAEDISECPPSPPPPSTRRGPVSSSSRHSREAASTLRGPPPSAVRKEGAHSGYSTYQGTKKTMRPRPALNPAAAYAPSRIAKQRADDDAAGPRSGDMARRSHSLPVPTIVIHEPTCE